MRAFILADFAISRTVRPAFAANAANSWRTSRSRRTCEGSLGERRVRGVRGERLTFAGRTSKKALQISPRTPWRTFAANVRRERFGERSPRTFAANALIWRTFAANVRRERTPRSRNLLKIIYVYYIYIIYPSVTHIWSYIIIISRELVLLYDRTDFSFFLQIHIQSDPPITRPSITRSPLLRGF